MIAQDQQSRVFYELCALLLSILRPPPLSVSESPPPSPATAPPRRLEISPSALASLLLGVSMALMLCGSVTFVIGFILMPWVLGLVMIFYFFGLVSNLSGLGKAILLGNNSTVSERNEMPVSHMLLRSYISKHGVVPRVPLLFFHSNLMMDCPFTNIRGEFASSRLLALKLAMPNQL